MEQAVNPMNRITAPNTMSVSWPRSIARSWSSERPLPNIATIPDSMSTLTDVRLILEHDAWRETDDPELGNPEVIRNFQ
jgi:hypothetical protein